MTVTFEEDELRELFLRRAEDILRSPTQPAFHPQSPFAAVLRMNWFVMRNVPIEDFRAEMRSMFEEAFGRFQLLLKVQAEAWKRDAPDYRLLCVSERKDSILMWSHYSDYHKGVVLGLRAIEELDAPLCAAKPVKYSETIPVFATLTEWADQMLGMIALDHSDQFEKQAFTKHIDWSYEKEWRVLTRSHPTDAGDHEDTPFFPQEIETIFFGCRIDAQDREKLLELLTGHWSHVQAFQAYQLPKSYALDFQPVR